MNRVVWAWVLGLSVWGCADRQVMVDPSGDARSQPNQSPIREGSLSEAKTEATPVIATHWVGDLTWSGGDALPQKHPRRAWVSAGVVELVHPVSLYPNTPNQLFFSIPQAFLGSQEVETAEARFKGASDREWIFKLRADQRFEKDTLHLGVSGFQELASALLVDQKFLPQTEGDLGSLEVQLKDRNGASVALLRVRIRRGINLNKSVALYTFNQEEQVERLTPFFANVLERAGKTYRWVGAVSWANFGEQALHLQVVPTLPGRIFFNQYSDQYQFQNDRGSTVTSSKIQVLSEDLLVLPITRHLLADFEVGASQDFKNPIATSIAPGETLLYGIYASGQALENLIEGGSHWTSIGPWTEQRKVENRPSSEGVVERDVMAGHGDVRKRKERVQEFADFRVGEYSDAARFEWAESLAMQFRFAPDWEPLEEAILPIRLEALQVKTLSFLGDPSEPGARDWLHLQRKWNSEKKAMNERTQLATHE